jgi:cysteinyl-tRNA synthetase
MSSNYRQQLNFTFDGLEAARASLERYNDFIVNLEAYEGGESNGEAQGIIDQSVKGFEESLDDDLNISGALGAVFDFIRGINALRAAINLSADERDQALETIKKFDSVLNFRLESGSLEDHVESMIEKRNQARKDKDFATADQIRDDLDKMGIILEDTPQGVRWKRKV